jgi:hypothetical protein
MAQDKYIRAELAPVPSLPSLSNSHKPSQPYTPSSAAHTTKHLHIKQHTMDLRQTDSDKGESWRSDERRATCFLTCTRRPILPAKNALMPDSLKSKSELNKEHVVGGLDT